MTKVQLGLTVCSVGPAAWEYTWPLWRRGDIYLNCARPGLLLLRTRISFVLDQSFKKEKKSWTSPFHSCNQHCGFVWVPNICPDWLLAYWCHHSSLLHVANIREAAAATARGDLHTKGSCKWGCKQTSGASILEAASRGRAGEKKEIIGTSVLPASFSTCKFVPYTLK